MLVRETPFEGLLLIEPRVYADQRGYFFESWNREAFARAGIPHEYVQDNQSGSAGGVIRGLHVQLPPHAQGKLVRVVRGSVLDVAIDLRTGQPGFGRHFSITLSASDHRMLYIPPGFAHGFRALENDTVFVYKCTAAYEARAERAIRWDDPDLGIDWGSGLPLLSEKDRLAMWFRDFQSPF